MHRVESMTALPGRPNKGIGSGTGIIRPRIRRHNLPRIRRRNSHRGPIVRMMAHPPFRLGRRDHDTHVEIEHGSNIEG